MKYNLKKQIKNYFNIKEITDLFFDYKELPMKKFDNVKIQSMYNIYIVEFYLKNDFSFFNIISKDDLVFLKMQYRKYMINKIFN